jgi:NADPH:quinone reductase-like Zn-dependent oxidoreductase
MRLYRLPKSESIDDLTLVEAEAPRPARGQVVVRMRAASLNFRDLMVVTGGYGRGRVPPDLVPVSDGAGEVAAVGPDVSRVKPGDRVAGIFMQRWLGGEIDAASSASALGGGIDGVLAEQVVFEADGLVHLPPHLSFEEGATLPCAAVTAWNALMGLKPVQPGQTVLTLGTGGVSIFALQFAHAAGARVIATSSSDAKLDKAKALGADDGINYKSVPEWQEKVRELTQGRGVDHVVEVGGAGTLLRSMQSTRTGGLVHIIGGVSGSGSGGEVNSQTIIRHNVTLRGVYVGSREQFEAMNRAIALHNLRPAIDRVFPFTEAKAAYRHLQSRTHFGKVVIAIA